MKRASPAARMNKSLINGKFGSSWGIGGEPLRFVANVELEKEKEKKKKKKKKNNNKKQQLICEKGVNVTHAATKDNLTITANRNHNRTTLFATNFPAEAFDKLVYFKKGQGSKKKSVAESKKELNLDWRPEKAGAS